MEVKTCHIWVISFAITKMQDKIKDKANERMNKFKKIGIIHRFKILNPIMSVSTKLRKTINMVRLKKKPIPLLIRADR
ncbi:hypothetical protein GCM10027189_13300 [Rufibacter soli]